LIAARQVAADGVELRDGTTAGMGDVIVTRENARRIRSADGRWVRNGDTWQVTAVHADGALTLRNAGAEIDASKRRQVVLDAHYVAEHVQLGYAITAHRAQGATVDTCHVVVSSGMTREAFYVAMTRGRQANTTYVVTEHADPEMEPHLYPSRDSRSTEQVLRDVLATEGTERSATEQLQQHLIERRLVRPATSTHSRHPKHAVASITHPLLERRSNDERIHAPQTRTAERRDMTANQQQSAAMPPQSSQCSSDDNDETNDGDTALQLLLTVEQAAHQLNIGRSMLYELLHQASLSPFGSAAADASLRMLCQSSWPDCAVAINAHDRGARRARQQ
jgi:hypothetical protein